MDDRSAPLAPAAAERRFLAKPDLAALIDLLIAEGYEVIGPTIDQEAIVYDRIRSVDDLPRGWTELQGPGSYRLHRRDDDLLFGYNLGPRSWKQFLFPSQATVATAEQTAEGWAFHDDLPNQPRFAFLGARACELAAIDVQDRVFLNGPYVDPVYQARREQCLIIPVQCTQAAPTCFCTSMGTGPHVTNGFDLALTELPAGFVVVAGTAKGQGLLDQLPTRPADAAELQHAQQAVDRAAQQVTKKLDTHDIRDLLMSNLEHPRWDEVAGRCLSCTNCTMVCPTCFCNSVREVSDLAGENIQRQRQWDSCFNLDFSYMNGGIVRSQIRHRYRQWLTHKVATWIDQYGVSGCVGCGRCITWCPVGIDLTEEVAAIRGAEP
jgi:ferredoxin